MTDRLAGKVSIITGTGGSIGRETALKFAREGAKVVGCNLSIEDGEATVEAVRVAGGRWFLCSLVILPNLLTAKR